MVSKFSRLGEIDDSIKHGELEGWMIFNQNIPIEHILAYLLVDFKLFKSVPLKRNEKLTVFVL